MPCTDVFRSPRFLGGRQQDSHEALRHLMDGVKEEHQELKRQQVRVLTAACPRKNGPLSIMVSYSRYRTNIKEIFTTEFSTYLYIVCKNSWKFNVKIVLLWTPYVIWQTIIFSCCGYFFLLLFFLVISSPNLSGRRLDVCHTSTHGVALVRI